MPLTDLLKPLELVSVSTTLGIRFWDPAMDTQVSRGLVVTASPESDSGLVNVAFQTASGIYSFRGLPGLQSVEMPEQAAEPLTGASPPQPKRYIIQVEDRFERFLPVAFNVELPLPYKGVYSVTPRSSPVESSLPKYYLFSSPSRPAAPGLAAVRASILERYTGNPAAYAVLEVQSQGEGKWYGIADSRGCISVLFPYPRVITRLGHSPPLLQVPLQEQKWDLSARIRYAPPALIYARGSRRPDLRSIINQGPALIWPAHSGPGVEVISSTLTYGQELVLRTGALSELLIDTAASPPS
jgi:hypothetical protein